jgi:outer membrane protein assembly factor BamB
MPCGVVYVTSQNYMLYAVNAADGPILATAAPGFTLFGSPSVSDGVAYVATYAGGIYASSLLPNLNTNAARRNAPPLPASLHPDSRLRVAP